MITVDAQSASETAQKVKAGVLPGAAKTLAEAVCRVMEQVGYIQKDKLMQGGGSYRYVSVEAVIDALRPEMIKQQLVLLPVGVTPVTCERFEGKNGGFQNRTQVIYTFKLMHAPTGEHEPVVVIGEAIDVGDKSSNKAMTAARKYALIMAFNIETGLDPDYTPSHEQERKPAAKAATPSAPKQAETKLADLCAEAVGKVTNREQLGNVYRQYDEDVKAGKFTAEEKRHLDMVFKAASAKYPAPPKPTAPKA